MAEAFYTKYRPKEWDEVCSQDSIIKILRKQVETKSYKNSYLFSGASGCGKTTVARIFANKINNGCGIPEEIDAASHNGVESIREIINSANERSLDSEYKIFIIDECHAISAQGWQAFLKCIEEPPEYTIFIFCTTEIQKVPDTIKNRCQRYTFGRIKTDKIIDRLNLICEKEGLRDYQTGIEYIAKLANGGMRTAISYLDKCAGYDKSITVPNVLKTLEHYPYELFFRLTDLLFKNDTAGVIKAINYFYNEGNDLKLFVDQYLNFILDTCKYSIFRNCDLTSLPSTMTDSLNAICTYTDLDVRLNTCLETLLNLKNLLKNDTFPKNTVEVTFLLLCKKLNP